MYCKLSTTCSNATEVAQWAAVDYNQQGTMASEMVDLIDYPLLHGPMQPEWPHRQCVNLAYPIRRVRAPAAAASFAICSPHLHRAIRGAQEVLPCVGWGVTASRLDLSSMTSFSGAGCGRLQLGAPNWALSVALLQVVDT